MGEVTVGELIGARGLHSRFLKRSEMAPELYAQVTEHRRSYYRRKAAERRQNSDKLNSDNARRATIKREARRSAQRWPAYALVRCVPCTISVSDIQVPDICPVLGIPIILGVPKGSPNLPSVDRKIPALGYVPGNVCVISSRANVLKNNCTDAAELLRVALYIKECVSS